MITPRYYQLEAVESLYTYFYARNGNPVIAMPTGTGKSVVIAMFLQRAFAQYSGQRVLVLTHVKELVAQNHAKLMALWPTAPAGINSAGLKRRDVLQPIVFGGIASVYKHAGNFGRIDLVIIDEAHLVSPTESTMYQSFLAALRTVNANLKVIGLTATPWRLGHGRITDEGGLFSDICYDLTALDAFNRLITEGYMSPLIPRRTAARLNVEGVHMRGGDYVLSELQDAVDKTEVTRAALREMLELGQDRRSWLIFASGVEHAEHVRDMLRTMGVACTTVHSRMPTEERDAAIRGFRDGTYRAITNNNVLTTGFDHPGIDLIGMLRPTQSPVLWVQMLGRGTRPSQGKNNCLVLDFAGNTARLGPINDPVVPHKKGEGGGTAPIKECPQCQTYNHASVRQCVNCGYEFPIAHKLHGTASNEELLRGARDLPEVKEFTVDHMSYAAHRSKKPGAVPCLRVSYFCGHRIFNEFVFLQGQGSARRRAALWWQERTAHLANQASRYTPRDVAEALQLTGLLRASRKIRVVFPTDSRYPEIVGHTYEELSAAATQPSVPALPDVRPRTMQRADVVVDLRAQTTAADARRQRQR